MERRVFKKTDLIILALLLAAAVAALVFWPRHKGHIAVVVYDGEIVQQIPLSEDGIYHIDADLPVTLEVKDGEIRFIDSVCPDHICENAYGFIGDVGEDAICLPAKVAVTIEEQ